MHAHAGQRRGITLLETLVLVIILGIVGTSAANALRAVAKAPEQTESALQEETLLVSKLEQVRSAEFDNIPTGTAVSPYSDTVLVDVALADPSGGSTANANWKRVTVRIANGRQLVFFVCKP